MQGACKRARIHSLNSRNSSPPVVFLLIGWNFEEFMLRLVNNSRGLQQYTASPCISNMLLPSRLAWLPKPDGEIDRFPPVITQKNCTSITVFKRCLKTYRADAGRSVERKESG